MGEGEGGGEEGVELVFPEGGGEGVGEGVVEGGGAGHLAFPLAEPGHRVNPSPGHPVTWSQGRRGSAPGSGRAARQTAGRGRPGAQGDVAGYGVITSLQTQNSEQLPARVK